MLSKSPSGQSSSGLTTNIAVIAVDPATNTSSLVRGRGFVGGKTYSSNLVGSPPALVLESWVVAGTNGNPTANTSIPPISPSTVPPGIGFPGTESTTTFNGADVLLKPSTFVFVADTDGDLSTHETFPVGRQIRVEATTAVRSTSGRPLIHPALGSTTVGPDTISPEVRQTASPNSHPDTSPALGDTGVDTLTKIVVHYTEPVQPLSVGNLPSGLIPVPSPAIAITFGPNTQVVTVPFSILPVSIYDFSAWELTPAFNFPGSGPVAFNCGTFSTVTVDFNANQVLDLRANANSTPAQTSFETGEGPGLVNAPVTPDVIYCVRGGGETPGISVLDLNGFGQSTGNPTFVANLLSKAMTDVMPEASRTPVIAAETPGLVNTTGSVRLGVASA